MGNLGHEPLLAHCRAGYHYRRCDGSQGSADKSLRWTRGDAEAKLLLRLVGVLLHRFSAAGVRIALTPQVPVILNRGVQAVWVRASKGKSLEGGKDSSTKNIEIHPNTHENHESELHVQANRAEFTDRTHVLYQLVQDIESQRNSTCTYVSLVEGLLVKCCSMTHAVRSISSSLTRARRRFTTFSEP